LGERVSGLETGQKYFTLKNRFEARLPPEKTTTTNKWSRKKGVRLLSVIGSKMPLKTFFQGKPDALGLLEQNIGSFLKRGPKKSQKRAKKLFV